MTGVQTCALPIFLGLDHSDTRLFRKNLADAYRAVGRDGDAEALIDPPSDPDDADAEAPA